MAFIYFMNGSLLECLDPGKVAKFKRQCDVTLQKMALQLQHQAMTRALTTRTPPRMEDFQRLAMAGKMGPTPNYHQYYHGSNIGSVVHNNNHHIHNYAAAPTPAGATQEQFERGLNKLKKGQDELKEGMKHLAKQSTLNALQDSVRKATTAKKAPRSCDMQPKLPSTNLNARFKACETPSLLRTDAQVGGNYPRPGKDFLPMPKISG